MAYANLDGLGWLVEDMQTWTAAHYEPKLRFDPTPVYSVTFAEDTAVSDASPYEITSEQLGGGHREFFISITAPAVDAARTITCVFAYGIDGEEIVGVQFAHTSVRYSYLHFTCDNGMVIGKSAAGGMGSLANVAITSGPDRHPHFIDDAEKVSAIRFQSYSGVTIPSGTTITFYATEEV